jgi:hypothetical protein
MISRGQMYRQLYYGGGEGIASLDAGAPSIKYAGNIDPNKPTGPLAPFYEHFDIEKPKPKPESEQASAPDPMADLYDQFLSMKSQGIIPMNMSFNDFKELLREQSSSQGGIMDAVPREQALFGGLKKAVKKVTGAVSDFAKSDLGKAALLYAGTAGLGSLGAGGGFGSLFKLGTYAPGTVLANLGATATRFNPFTNPMTKAFGKNAMMGDPAQFFSSVAGEGMKKSTLATLGIAGASVLAGLSEGDREEIAQADPSQRGNIVKEKLRQSLTNLGYTGEELETKVNEGVSEYFSSMGGYAVGGRVKYALGDTAQAAAGIGGLPYRQNTAGIGEIDLRNTGGFIPPVGIKEKADDIPAMLSNNEFVFTADAVRAAGGGSVEKGAQKMYDLMKSLEGKIA